MISLTRPQRDFLDHFYTEYLKLEFGPATKLAAAHGFYYEHFKALFESYQQAWGESWGKWEDMSPPVVSFQSLTFPWDSVDILEKQLNDEGISFTSLPRLKLKDQG